MNTNFALGNKFAQGKGFLVAEAWRPASVPSLSPSMMKAGHGRVGSLRHRHRLLSDGAIRLFHFSNEPACPISEATVWSLRRTCVKNGHHGRRNHRLPTASTTVQKQLVCEKAQQADGQGNQQKKPLFLALSTAKLLDQQQQSKMQSTI
ncbi:hypothetical protein Tsp_13335 [Trichinella spiralis]|uniref:hypothetical protein n=1 Tax=Trichinella spiralis TaxID=6334 RepID=UPI0001EFE7D3|nr:hypothetical protein Tsp_13335 [Trichinella spiralis]